MKFFLFLVVIFFVGYGLGVYSSPSKTDEPKEARQDTSIELNVLIEEGEQEENAINKAAAAKDHAQYCPYRERH